MKFNPYLPAAIAGTPYRHEFTEGEVSIVSGRLPSGLKLENNVVSGVTTSIGTHLFQLEVKADHTIVRNGGVAVLRPISLDGCETQPEFMAAMQDAVSKRGIWSADMPSLTSTTLLQLLSTIAAFEAGKRAKVVDDLFQQTAHSVDKLRAIALMKGIRLSRKSPASVRVRFQGSAQFPAFARFSCGTASLVCIEDLNIVDAAEVTLYEGVPHVVEAKGLGSPHQSLIIGQPDFTVADSLVYVTVDGVKVERTINGLWHRRGESAFDDTTLADGRAELRFGTSVFGCCPAEGSEIKVTYIQCNGLNIPHLGTVILKDGIRGEVITPFIGGQNERSAAELRDMDVFGTFGSAVTKTQIRAYAMAYSGIVDATVERNAAGITVHALGTSAGLKAYLEEFTDSSVKVVDAKVRRVKMPLRVEGTYRQDEWDAVVAKATTLRAGVIGKSWYHDDIIALVRSVPGVTRVRGAVDVECAPDEALQLEITHEV